MVRAFSQILVGILLLGGILSGAGIRNAEASEMAPAGTWQRKFERGLLNAAFSPIEISHALAREKTKDVTIPTWAAGLIRGSIFAGVRALTGIYEVITAPIPIPAHYEPLLFPESPLEYLGSNAPAKTA